MNLIEELDAIFLSSAHGKDSATTLFWKLLDIAREMAKRLEGLEQQIVETNRRCKALHTIGRGPQRAAHNDQG